MSIVHDKLMEAMRHVAQQQGVTLPEQADLTGADRTPLQAALQAGLQGGLSPHEVSASVAQVLGVEVLTGLLSQVASAEFVERVPIGFARRHGVLGLAGEGHRMRVAVAELNGSTNLDVISRFMGRPVTPCLAPAQEVSAAINLAYQQRTGQAQAMIEDLNAREVLQEIEQLRDREDLLDIASRAPVIKLVNVILLEAVKQRASDVHVQPYEERLVVRLRIDGVLFDAFTLPKALQDEVVSRIKVMGRMNIAEKRLAQDGRATVQVGDRVVDLRIASLPTSFGERIVIRLLDKSARLYSLAEVGMAPASKERFGAIIGMEHGLILVTGPTGSGKSTTLYAALQELDATQLNILTLEDPIEYQLPGVSQTQISDKKGMTFASGLRHVLRQDPDVVMVGEIRDHETAVMAIQSALTGHLVFSTLHTNDAASAVARMLDLGIEPYLLASSLVGVLAQRLVRRVCDSCGRPHVPDAAELDRVDISPSADVSRMRLGPGCPDCRNTGYSGRVGIFELLAVNQAVRRQIQSRATAADVKAAAMAAGMTTLRDDGVAKILDGITTAQEVLRVSMRSEQIEVP